MHHNCPVLTPGERQINEIVKRSRQSMLVTVEKAVEHARQKAALQMAAVGSQEMPPAHEYFAAVVHQHMFCLLCEADPETLEGGNPEIAARILDNGRKIAATYWSRQP